MIHKKLVLIDGDGLLYHSSKETLEESIQSNNDRINNIFEKTNADYYAIFISNSPYFRHKIDSNYKSNRKKYDTPLKWIKTLKSYLIENWNAQSMRDVEADDLCAYWYNKKLYYGISSYELAENFTPTIQEDLKYLSHPEEINIILASPDKDLLQSISGKHFNYSYKLEDKNNPNSIIKGWWVETTLEESYTNFWVSMIKGDASDGIKGLPGKGEGFIKKEYGDLCILNDSMVYYQYCQHYGQSQGIYEFQKNYRLLHLLENDEDFLREVGYIPSFPNIQKVNKNEITEDLI